MQSLDVKSLEGHVEPRRQAAPMLRKVASLLGVAVIKSGACVNHSAQCWCDGDIVFWPSPHGK